MPWFAARCPVTPHEQEWVSESMDEFVTAFGREPMRRPVITPSDEFFPGIYAGSDDDVRRVFRLVAEYMRVDRAAIDLELEADDPQLDYAVTQRHGAAGLSRSGLGKQWAQ